MGGIPRIRCGTCAWSDHQRFYPPGLRPNRYLAYYAQHFPLVEVDSSFYHIPPPRHFERWAAATPQGFLFNVKVYRAMTQHDRRRETPNQAAMEELAETFAAAVASLEEAGKLGALHFQFPPWFEFGPAAMEWIRFWRGAYPRALFAVEFRNKSWFEAPNLRRTLGFLEELEAVHVICDEPQLGSGSVPGVLAVTQPDLSIVRFHGRNRRTWYKKVKSTGERFKYRYSRPELEAWLPRIERLAGSAREVHLLMNNNYGDYAVTGAKELMSLLGLQWNPSGPGEEDGPAQLRLFD